ncbi:hypothetical protein PCL_00876 [Purpureocillium lilacinum]|uniref:Uncharacterized protein n=1 Tax=Purpureocillium lilacinum TaxID=33203 RepID=A0A2U3E415_PURLI|nr:hypothetical protein PCL_00876 [Purpureocillium lilacinum]
MSWQGMDGWSNVWIGVSDAKPNPSLVDHQPCRGPGRPLPHLAQCLPCPPGGWRPPIWQRRVLAVDDELLAINPVLAWAVPFSGVVRHSALRCTSGRSASAPSGTPARMPACQETQAGLLVSPSLSVGESRHLAAGRNRQRGPGRIVAQQSTRQPASEPALALNDGSPGAASVLHLAKQDPTDGAVDVKARTTPAWDWPPTWGLGKKHLGCMSVRSLESGEDRRAQKDGERRRQIAKPSKAVSEKTFACKSNPPKRHVPATGQFPYLPPPAKRLPRLHVVIAHERTRQKALRLHRRRPAKQGLWHGNVFGDTCIVRCDGTRAARRSGILSRAWTHANTPEAEQDNSPSLADSQPAELVT